MPPPRVDAARAVVDRQASATLPVYGINTGFGALAETAIPRDALGALQLNLLRSHAAGVGEPLPVRAVRASMALRANVLAKGFSGIRRATLERLVDLLNRRVHPRVPSRGSVGASGDLAPLAHLSLVLIGEGEAWVGDDPSLLQAATRCAPRASTRWRSAPKEGLALINGTQPSTAVAALAAAGADAARPGRRHRRGALHRRAARIGAALRPPHSRRPSVPRPDGVGGEHPHAARGQRDQQVARALRAGPGRLLAALRRTGPRRGARSADLRAHAAA